MGEFFVLTDCTLPYSGLVTGALTGAGTTDQWTGIFSDINQAAYSDATPNHDNLAGNNQQYNLTDLPTAPAGGWAIPAVKIEARSKKSPGSTLAHLKLGYNSGGSVAFGTGANKALTSSDETYEQIDQINPVTSTVFTESEINALQSNMQSAT